DPVASGHRDRRELALPGLARLAWLAWLVRLPGLAGLPVRAVLLGDGVARRAGSRSGRRPGAEQGGGDSGGGDDGQRLGYGTCSGHGDLPVDVRILNCTLTLRT